MDIVDQSTFQTLCQTGDIRHEQCEFLDGVTIGLRLMPEVVQLFDHINVKTVASERPVRIDLSRQLLVKGKVYVAQTVERISLPNNVAGFLHTLPRWANFGLDCVGSANYLPSGFGASTPAPLALWLKPSVSLSGIDLKEAFAGLVLFRL